MFCNTLKMYAYNLVAGLNQLYAVGMIIQISYFAAKGEKGSKFTAVLEGIGQVLPTEGNYLSVIADLVATLSEEFTQKEFARFIQVASGPVGMEEIAQGVFYELALATPSEELNERLFKQHLEKITKALWREKLKKFTKPGADRKQFIHALANAAEGKLPNNQRNQQLQVPDKQTALRTSLREVEKYINRRCCKTLPKPHLELRNEYFFVFCNTLGENASLCYS